MKKITISKMIAVAFIAAFSVTTGFAQTNLGSECGCPPVGTAANPAGRGTAIDMSSFCDPTTNELTADVTLTCDKNYTLDKKIYVPKGKTLTIKPGVVVKGKASTTATDASGLIIERGGKIIADGTQSCPIVFAALADPLDGTFSMQNSGQWGGVVLLGIAPNNLQPGNTYYAGPTPSLDPNSGVGFIEGFTGGNGKDLYGAGDVAFPTSDVNDNSGILRYVSIRNAGALVGDANELNALSLGSVGRGTTIEHVETIGSADDNFEMFGGTVNLKYCSTLFGDDDFFDWDLGWQGKAQFLFGMAADSSTLTNTLYGSTSDNGFEADADDDKKAPTFLRSHPIIYNVTLMGNGHILPRADNTGGAAIQAKELTEGEIYNSIFANFRSGLHLAKNRDAQFGDAYDNWTNSTTAFNNGGTGKAIKNSLVVKNNTFVGFGSDPVKSFYITTGALVSGKNATIAYKAATAATADDITQFTTTDGNSVVASVPGIDANWFWDDAVRVPPTPKNVGHTTYNVNGFHATPVTNINSSITPPADGFFSVVKFRGAFDATKGSWLSDWAKAQIATSQQSNPTDLNNDGKTDGADFLIFGGAYGTTNQ
jgi:hypothetical protein